MEEERATEQEGGEAEPVPEEEEAKLQHATENAKTSEKSAERSGGTRPFSCSACQESFPSRTALSIHYNSASHIQRMTSGSAKPAPDIGPQSPAVQFLSRQFVTSKPYQCAVCRVSYNHAITLESHMKSVLHQTRSRNAGMAANSAAGSAATTTEPRAGPVAGSCATPGKDKEQLASSQVAPSLLPSSVASTQAVSAFLTLSHSLLPSLFAASAPTPQLVPQPHMVMPLILNGLQAQTQQHPDNQQGPLLTQCLPFVGLNPAQQALLTQRLNSLQNQWPSSVVPPHIRTPQEEQKQTLKCEGEEKQGGEESASEKEENPKEKAESNEEELQDNRTDRNQPDPEGDKEAGPIPSHRNNSPSPSASVPSHSSLSPVNLDLTLSPDSTPQKPGTSPGASPKSSTSTNALTTNQTRLHWSAVGSDQPDLPVLSEFQSEVLWAFLESRSEADAASPPRDDCEALGKEVGLSEEEVRRWLAQARQLQQRRRGSHLLAERCTGGFDHDDEDEEESSLVIAEGEDDEAEASGSQVMDLSCGRGKRKRGSAGRGGPADPILTSDSENEAYTSVIVSDEESKNESFQGGHESPAKEEAQREVPGDKGSAGGKVLRSTTVFLSDAEEEYEEEEGGEGQRARRKKWKGDFERDDMEVKKERPDPDVDLELEAQGDPPSSHPSVTDHPEIPAGGLHSLPLSLGPFSPQFLSPYVLSLTPSVVSDGGKISVFPNAPTLARFSSSFLSQSLSPFSQTPHYLSNGDDCEAALDLSMGKSGAKTSSSSPPSLAEKMAAQKGQLLDGLGLRPTSKGLVVVQVKPEPPSNSPLSLVNVGNANTYPRASEKVSAALLEREQQQRKSKGKRYMRDMRRSRTIIQAEQLDVLYGCYFKDPNPGKHEFEQISEWVHLPKKVVQIWFQNMRARERKGEVRFISDGTLAAVGKPLIKFTWPLSKPIFSNKPVPNSAGGIPAAPIVRTLMKTNPEPEREPSKAAAVKKTTPVPIKPKEVVSCSSVSPVGSGASAVPKTKVEPAGNVSLVKIAPMINAPMRLPPPKDLVQIAPRVAQKLEEESEDEKTDEEREEENEVTVNRMVPKLPTTPINNRLSATTVVPPKQNGLNYWTPKVPIKINTLSREQLALPAHTPPRTIPPPPTPSIAPVSPNAPGSAKPSGQNTPILPKPGPTEGGFLSNSSSRRPRTHLSCLQLSILQSCYETCAHPNAMECEAIGNELNLPLKVVQIWFQNTRAKEKRWRLQQEKMVRQRGDVPPVGRIIRSVRAGRSDC